MIKFRLLSLKTKLYADNPKEVTIMKEGIHPKYEPTEVRCACGEVIKTSSTKQDLRVDICSKVPSVLHRQAEARRYRRTR